MTDTIIDIDTQILLYINSLRSDFLDCFMWIYTNRFTWIALYLSLIIVFFKSYRIKGAITCVILTTLVILIADQTCSHLLRPYFMRMRPTNPDNPVSAFITIYNGYRSGAYGFPSCHGSNSFALATFTSLLFRNRAYSVFIFLWAAINCYSRIYLGVHYPGDIIVGAAIGIMAALAVYYATKLLSARTSHFLPAKRIFDGNSAGCFTIKVSRYTLRLNDTSIVVATGIVTILIIALCSL